MKSRLAALVATLAVVPVAGVSMAASAPPPEGFRGSQALTIRVAKISRVATAGVFCATSRAAWEDFAIEKGGYAGAHGLVIFSEQTAYLAPYVCSPLERWLRGKRVTRPALARGLHVFVHEAIHLRGVRSECATESRARRELPTWMRQLFGVKNPATRAALMRLVRAEPLC